MFLVKSLGSVETLELDGDAIDALLDNVCDFKSDIIGILF
jgi:hypothetical protein